MILLVPRLLFLYGCYVIQPIAPPVPDPKWGIEIVTPKVEKARIKAMKAVQKTNRQIIL